MIYKHGFADNIPKLARSLFCTQFNGFKYCNITATCSPIARETWVQSQVESYQRLKKWYLMPPCLTLSIIRYGSRVKWSNPGKGVAASPTPWCSKLSKREPSGHPRLWSPTFLLIYLHTYFVLFDPYIGSYQVLSLRVKMDLGAMAMKGYLIFAKSPNLEPHHLMV